MSSLLAHQLRPWTALPTQAEQPSADFAIGALQTQNISRSYRVDLVCVILQSPYNKC